MNRQEAIELGFKKVETNLSKYKFSRTEIYQTTDHEVAFYDEEVMKQYPHLKECHGDVKRINI